ncbi:hypothetical protein HQ590_08200 [bacterium]|nr:hypothetical protein [bacterium]
MPNPSQSLTITNRIHRRFAAYPVSVGVPWPKELLADPTLVTLKTPAGEPVPVAATVLNRWPDGSVQWTLLDFAVDLEASGERRLVMAADGSPCPPPPHPVTVKESADAVTVGNGKVRLTLGRTAALVRAWTVDGRAVVEPDSFDLVVTDPAGKEFRAAGDARRRVTVEHANPLRAVVRVDGTHTAADGTTLLHYWLKFTATAGRPDVKVSYQFRNREQPVPGVAVQELRLVARLAVPRNAPRTITQRNRGRQYLTAAIRVPDDFEIFSSDTNFF